MPCTISRWLFFLFLMRASCWRQCRHASRLPLRRGRADLAHERAKAADDLLGGQLWGRTDPIQAQVVFVDSLACRSSWPPAARKEREAVGALAAVETRMLSHPEMPPHHPGPMQQACASCPVVSIVTVLPSHTPRTTTRPVSAAVHLRSHLL